MTTMTLPLSAVASMATLAAALKLSKYAGETTPVLTFLQVTATENGGFSALATDRYRVGRIDWTPEQPETPHAIPGSVAYIHGETLVQFVKMLRAGKALPSTPVTLQQDDAVPVPFDDRRTTHGPLHLSANGMTTTARDMPYNFPPVDRLMLDSPATEGVDVAARVMLKPSFLAQLATMAGVEETATEAKEEPWAMVQTEVPARSTYAKQASQPVTFYRSGRSHKRRGDWVLTYMVQPNMGLDTKGARA